jgi:hypothetical protein
MEGNMDQFMDSQIAKVLTAVKNGKMRQEDLHQACWYYLEKMLRAQAAMAQEQSEENYGKYFLNMTLYTIHLEASHKLLSV